MSKASDWADEARKVLADLPHTTCVVTGQEIAALHVSRGGQYGIEVRGGVYTPADGLTLARWLLDVLSEEAIADSTSTTVRPAGT